MWAIISFVELLLLSLFTIIPLLISVAFFTLLERKVMGSIQRRHGPTEIGFWGLLQALADGLKLVLKEVILPTRANYFLFILAPILSFSISFTGWSLIPFGFASVISDTNFGLLFLFALSSLNVYSLILSGWSSNSKYALLGSLRAISQMISYEVVFALSIMPIVVFCGSLNLTDIVNFQQDFFFFFPLFPMSFIFFVCIVAETNRTPFDLPEAEAEIVAGYNVEYSSITFALFFLGEYCSIMLMSALWVVLFFGGWLSPFWVFNWLPSSVIFALKIVFICFLFVLIRAVLPRYRFDQLMSLCWKNFLPISFGYLVFISGLLFYFDLLLDLSEINFFLSPSSVWRSLY
jgi:NADH-quinone oxidoreductase subunit H